jgi:hypothetical protein
MLGTLVTLSAVSILGEDRSNTGISEARTAAAQAIWVQTRSVATKPRNALRSFVIPISLQASAGAGVELEGRPAAAGGAGPGGFIVADLATDPIELMTNLLSYSGEPRYLHFDSTETALLVGQSAGSRLRRSSVTAAITTGSSNDDGLAARLCGFARGLLRGGVLPIFRVDAQAMQRPPWNCIRSLLPFPVGLQLAATDASPLRIGRWFERMRSIATKKAAEAGVFLVGPHIASKEGEDDLALQQAVAAIESGAVSVVANRHQRGILRDRLAISAEGDERVQRGLVAAGTSMTRLLARIPPTGRPPNLIRRRPERRRLRIRLPELGAGRSQASRPSSPRNKIRAEKPPAQKGLQLPSIGERKR